MDGFPQFEEVKELILLAAREDLGQGPADGRRPQGGLPLHTDLTSRLLVDESAVGVGTLVQRQVGIVAGLPIVPMVCRCYDPRLRVEQIPGLEPDGVRNRRCEAPFGPCRPTVPDPLFAFEGRFSEATRTPLLRIRGPMRSLLAAERVILNFLQHLSGVATLTSRFVQRIEGTSARIFDTRKTLPGFRLLDKYAVRCGGGHNHRMGLYDGLLVKDNHLAGIPIKDLADFLRRIVAEYRVTVGGACTGHSPVEVEVDNLEQFSEVLKVEGVDVILLDNMDCPSMAAAVRLRNAGASHPGLPQIEASGGITLDVVRSVAQAGVDRIAVGAITHSAPALDIGLDIE